MTDYPADDALSAWARRHGLEPVRDPQHAGDEREVARALLADSLAELGEHGLAHATRAGANAGEPLAEAALMAIITALHRVGTGAGRGTEQGTSTGG